MRFRFGLFGLLILIGNMIGSSFGMAVAICVWMILDEIIEIWVMQHRKNIFNRKKEAK